MYTWGIEVIKIIQRIENPVTTALVKAFTALGTEMLYLPLILFIFWWIDEKQGLRFGLLIILTAWINSFLKEFLKQPRPFLLEPDIGLAYEPTYSTPSGHAQNSLCFWIPFTAWIVSILKKKVGEKLNGKMLMVKTRLIWAGVILFLLLIGFSRLYLGVHYPTDVLAGWFLGGIILVVWFYAVPHVENFLTNKGARMQNICAALLALIMNGLYPHDGMLPALFLGFCLGYTLMKMRFPFSASLGMKGKKIRTMVLRCLVGFAGLVIIYLGLKLILPGEASSFYELGRFIRYGLIGFWASAGAPAVFQRIGLAPNTKRNG